MDPHSAAWFSLGGALLGALGGLYLAYDLLGGKNGPLASVTRFVTYGFIFGIGYGLGLGLKFGLVAGVGLGLLLGLEYFWISGGKQKRLSKQHSSIVLGVGRGCVLSLALALTVQPWAGLFFLPFSAVFLSLVNIIGLAPGDIRRLKAGFDFNVKDAFASFLRGLLTGVALYVVYLGIPANNLPLSRPSPLRFGCTIGATSLLIGIFTPMVEYWSEQLPKQWLTYLGALFVIGGFLLQTVPNWAVLLN